MFLNFIYFWPHWVIRTSGRLLSSCGEQSYSPAAVCRFLTEVAALVQSTSSTELGLQYLQLEGSGAWAQ